MVEENHILVMDVIVCPATGAHDSSNDNLIRELSVFLNIQLSTRWVINSIMRDHCKDYDTMLLVGVFNHNPYLLPEEAKRTSKVMSVTRLQFEDFFVGLEFKASNYLFVKVDVFEAITKKYF
tara:strand:+ start:57 stop:422 length:366 start_codon:yes stop_codon:yes gene_type:complete